jgi:hypothetical protein
MRQIIKHHTVIDGRFDHVLPNPRLQSGGLSQHISVTQATTAALEKVKEEHWQAADTRTPQTRSDCGT